MPEALLRQEQRAQRAQQAALRAMGETLESMLERTQRQDARR